MEQILEAELYLFDAIADEESINEITEETMRVFFENAHYVIRT